MRRELIYRMVVRKQDILSILNKFQDSGIVSSPVGEITEEYIKILETDGKRTKIQLQIELIEVEDEKSISSPFKEQLIATLLEDWFQDHGVTEFTVTPVNEEETVIITGEVDEVPSAK